MFCNPDAFQEASDYLLKRTNIIIFTLNRSTNDADLLWLKISEN